MMGRKLAPAGVSTARGHTTQAGWRETRSVPQLWGGARTLGL